MALLDFLNQGIGGMQQAQGPNMTGNAGVGTPQPIGPTWGDMLKGGITYGSKPGSSGPMIAQQIRPLQPTPLIKSPQEKKKEEGGEDSLAQIASLIMGLMGGV